MLFGRRTEKEACVCPGSVVGRKEKLDTVGIGVCLFYRSTMMANLARHKMFRFERMFDCRVTCGDTDCVRSIPSVGDTIFHDLTGKSPWEYSVSPVQPLP